MAQNVAECVTRNECVALMASVTRSTDDLKHVIGDDEESGMRGDVRKIRDTLSEMKGAETQRKKDAESQNQLHTDQLNAITEQIAQKSLETNNKSLVWNIAGVLVSFSAMAFMGVLWVVGQYFVKHGELSPPEILHPQQQAQQYVASANQKIAQFHLIQSVR